VGSSGPQWWGTWPNRITTVRAAGTAVMLLVTLAMLTTGAHPSRVATVALVGLCCEVLDGVDGSVARRLGQATAYGARFDMEVDAAMVMVLSLALVASGVAGGWVLLIGGWRYGYVLAARIVPALRRPLPYRYSRKVIAAAVALSQVAALLLTLTPAQPAFPTVILVAALGVLTWSFVRDIVWQLGNRDLTGT